MEGVGIQLVLLSDATSTVEGYYQLFGDILSVLLRDTISTMEGYLRYYSEEYHQYYGVIPSYAVDS